MKAEREATLKVAAATMTFPQCAAAYLKEHLASFAKNAKHRAQWKTSLARANAAFGKLNVAEIDTPAVIKLLQPIWQRTPERGRLMKRVSV